LAEVYGFEACRIENQLNLKGELEEILSKPSAVVCEIMLSPTEKMEPKLSSKIKPDGKMVSKPLEDMFPFLPREEFYKNMIIKPVDE